MSPPLTYLKYLLPLCALMACSTQGYSPLGKTYHNTTARFNAYFIANEHMLEIEKYILDQYDWNYNKILPVYPQFDSTDAQALASQIEDCVQKASIAIQRHIGSKWEDDSYVLVGKSRFYSMEFADAIETFKYVNKNGQDDNSRHEALIQLIRTFIEFGEINNAISVSDYLKKEELNRKNLKDLYLCRAYLYQVRNDYDLFVQNLVRAEALMTRGRDKARIDFMIGQVYQQLGFDAEAYNYYSSSLRNNPSYELSFYTKLNMAQVTQLVKGNDLKKIRKYFRRLLKDPKNLEYQDKIYYEMAGFELKQGNIPEAIEFYRKSVKNSVRNQRQKAYSYLELGKIYYDSLKNFELAKNYYDSTVATMPKDEDGFAKIKHRQEVLSDFVDQITTIHTNDSLVALAALPEDSVVALARAKVQRDFEREKERKKREKRKSTRLATAFDSEGGALISANLKPGSIWYFYNSAAMSRGSSEFLRKWGDRPYEDNWRRSNKSGSSPVVETRTEQAQEAQSTEGEEEKMNKEIQALIANVPKTPEAIQSLLDEVEHALYNLGNIYNFKLEEKQNAILAFEQLLSRFVFTEYRPEVLYQLYLIYNTLHQEELASAKASELKSQFENTIYAKLVDNPNYREESQAATEQLKKVYTRAYDLYHSGLYEETRYLLDSALLLYPENDFSDNLKLLDVLCAGMIDGLYKYQYELNNFIKSFPESELVPYAQTLVKTSEEYQINIFNASKARFIEYFDQKHFLVVAYSNKDELAESIPQEVDEYIAEEQIGLSAGNLILDEQYAMVLVNDFANRERALSFLSDFDDLDLPNKHKGEKIYIFVISQDNFNVFYQTKDLNAYLNFYDRMYQ